MRCVRRVRRVRRVVCLVAWDAWDSSALVRDCGWDRDRSRWMRATLIPSNTEHAPFSLPRQVKERMDHRGLGMHFGEQATVQRPAVRLCSTRRAGWRARTIVGGRRNGSGARAGGRVLVSTEDGKHLAHIHRVCGDLGRRRQLSTSGDSGRGMYVSVLHAAAGTRGRSALCARRDMPLCPFVDGVCSLSASLSEWLRVHRCCCQLRRRRLRRCRRSSSCPGARTARGERSAVGCEFRTQAARVAVQRGPRVTAVTVIVCGCFTVFLYIFHTGMG
jgi:hypothetical protein